MILFDVDAEGTNFFFDNNGNYDLYTTVNVGVLDAITGCNINIDGVNGEKIPLYIPMGTKDDTILAVSNKGLLNNYGGRGDLKCVVSLDFPKSLGKESIETVNKLKENKDFKK